MAASGQGRWKRNFTDIRPADLLVSDGQSLYYSGSRLTPADGTDNRTPRDNASSPFLKYCSSFTGGMSILDMLAANRDPLQARDMKELPTDGRARGQMIAFDRDRSVASWRYRGGGKDFVRADDGRCQLISKGASEWTNKDTGQQMMGLVLAGSRIYGAGIPEVRDSQDTPRLWVFSAADGKILQQIPLEAAPSIDGLSAVGGKLVVTTVDGQVMCFDSL